jgi:hypothetical protein
MMKDLHATGVCQSSALHQFISSDLGEISKRGIIQYKCVFFLYARVHCIMIEGQ